LLKLTEDIVLLPNCQVFATLNGITQEKKQMEKIWLKSYPKGVPAEINPDEYASLADLFEQTCKKYQDKIAMINFGTGMSYNTWREKSYLFAGYLQNTLGLRKGDRFAIMLPNILQYPVALMGALLAGLVIVNVNPLYTEDELAHQLCDAEADAILVLSNFAYKVEDTLPKTKLRHVIVTDLGDLFSLPKSLLMGFVLKYIKRAIPRWNIPTAISFKSTLIPENAAPFKPVTLTGADIAFLQYTGGTTGVAKGAVLTHRNILANVAQAAAWISSLLHEGKEFVVTALPMYHVFSLTVNCFIFVREGATNLLITNPRDIRSFVKTLSKVPFSVLTGVNTLFNALLNNPDFAKIDFSHLKITLGGGMAVQHAVADHWQKVTGKVLLEAYGLTETSPAVTCNPIDSQTYNGNIGLPLPSTDILLCDETGKEVPLGTPGELCVKGPQVMREYWHHPKETAEVFFDGWLKTGDIATMNEQGFLKIVDRKKDMIIVSGFNVYPNEVEDVIASHPDVLEVAVIGHPDNVTGEGVYAYIVSKNAALSASTVIAYCHEHLANYKVPKHVEFRESLPKSSVGKILRREVR
jgi:long-chain acyl-CoA synthetase